MQVASRSVAPYSASRVRRSLAHFVVGKSVGVVCGLGLLLLLVRALSATDYGFYIASQALLELVGQFSSIGIVVAAQRYLPELLSQSEGRRLARLCAFLCTARLLTLLMAVALIYPFASLLTGSIGLDGMTHALRLFLVVVVLECFARFLDVVFDSLLMQGISQISMLLRAGTRVGLLTYFVVRGNSVIELETWIAIDAAAALVGCAWGAASLWRFSGGIARQHPGEDAHLDVRRYIRYVMPTFVAASIYTVSGPNTVKVIASRVLSTVQFASFGFAAAFASMLQRYLPVFLLIGMIRPLFVAARQRDDYQVRLPAMAALVFKLNAFALVPVVACIAVAGEPLANVLTGGRYPEAGGYLLAFTLVLIAQALRAVASMTAQALENARAPLAGTFLGLIGLLIGVGLSQSIGGYGLCIGLVLSEVGCAAWVLIALRSDRILFRIDWRGYARMTIAAAGSAVIASLVLKASPSSSSLVLGASVAAGMVVFLVSAYVLKPFSTDERDTVNRLLNKRVFVW